MEDLNDILRTDGSNTVRALLDTVYGNTGIYAPERLLKASGDTSTPAPNAVAWRSGDGRNTAAQCKPSGANVLVGDVLAADQKTWIEVKEGEQPRQVDETLAVMRLRGGVYERGFDIVQVQDGLIRVMSEQWLRDWIGRTVQFYSASKEDRRPRNVPKDIVQQIKAKGDRRFPVLRSVITAPTLRPDGSILNKPGYDEKSGMLLLPAEQPFVEIITKPADPSSAYRHAFETIWYPFKEFPFISRYDRGVLVSAVLTAVIRPSLKTAPGIALTASMAASGKTLLAKCLAALMGVAGDALPPVNSEEELRKRLHSCLRSGDTFILFDNVMGVLDSPALASFLTAEIYGDRVLGASQKESLPNSALFVVTGNNLTLRGDLWRRFITCRIDPETEAPEERDFELKPKEYCTEHRQEIVSAALTLLRGYIQAGRPKLAKDGMASFEHWNDTVRQCVLWLQQEGHTGEIELGDPCQSIKDAKQANPERETLKTMLDSLRELFPDRAFSVADIFARIHEAAGLELVQNDDDHPVRRLQDAVSEITSGKSYKVGDAAAKVALGYWLKQNLKVRCGGSLLRKEPSGNTRKSQRYRVVATQSAIVDGSWGELF